MATEAASHISGGSESTTGPLLEQLAEVFGKLKSHTEASLQLQSGIQWEDIKVHFVNLEKSYRSKCDELEEKQKALEEHKAGGRRLIAEKEADLSAKERASVNKLQELRDAAVSTLAEVRNKYNVELSEILEANGSKDKKVKTPTNDTSASLPSEEHTSAKESGKPSEPSPVEAKPRPALKQLCEQMDAKGLLKYISENSKKLAGFRDELCVALKCATDPARFVLDSLEGFFPDQLPGDKNHSVQGQRRSCIVLMEAIAHSLGMKEPGGKHLWSSEIMEQAKAIAEEWKSKIAEVDLDASDGYSLEAQAFLQLLATFNIDLVLDEDELCKIVVAVSRRKQAAELCRSLGFAERIPGVIEELIKKHRQIDAVQFIQAFGLSEAFPPAPLLKAYVDDLKVSLNNKGDAGATPSADDLKNRELLALRAIIKCIEEYKLQKECPLGPLQKRINELKPKGSKRSGSAIRGYAKKPRVSGFSAPRRPTAAAPRRPAAPVGAWQQRAPPPVPAYPDRYGVAADRYHYAPPPAAAYEAATYAAYGGGGGSEQYRAPAPKPYQYNPGSAAAAAASYNNIPQYKVMYGGPGAQPSAAGGFAAYGAAAQQPQPAASSGGYLSYAAGFGYRPSQQQ
ncbi:FRIGIDA-like protein 3 [Hordeum vulgare]|uniref:FRIGIDA-like protein n=1 Tax=Hordeum vulgare subsp. vulgare TaxID=112509 RepID=A0A8I7B466_HORVV|nr:FRIGIDA-like protein 3 [Hordeum vulgare subsp. vulgare]KAE8783268.1 FRIGIDA-like protein 3 [Hordeum vulgare]